MEGLKRFNERRLHVLCKILPEDRCQGLMLAVRSARALKIVTPGEQSRALGKKNPTQVIDALSKKIEHILSNLEGDFLLGDKILDLDTYRAALDRSLRSVTVTEEEFLARYWIDNFDRLPRNGLLEGRAGEVLRNSFSELSLGLRLTIAEVGVLVQKRFTKAGHFLTKFPIRYQLTQDIISAATQTNNQGEEKSQNIAQRYGLSGDDVTVFAHPDFRTRIRNSLALNVGIYTVPRQVIGWATYGFLLVSPEFRQLVMSHGIETVLTAGGILLAGAMARARIDYTILKERQFSPDILETGFGVISGRIHRGNKLRTNPTAGLLGAPIDIAISSLQPPYSAAWFADPPYSIPAYLLAMYIDQVVFAVTNVAWGVSSKIQEKVKKRKNAK